MEDNLRRLDRLTQEEARMASAEQLKMAHSIDEKLDDTNRSSYYPSFFIQNAQTCSQDTYFVTISYDGFHLQIHPRIIILQQKLITMAHLNGSSKVVSFANGSPLVPSCGFTENVRSP